jgi:hypothetical protein
MSKAWLLFFILNWSFQMKIKRFMIICCYNFVAQQILEHKKFQSHFTPSYDDVIAVEVCVCVSLRHRKTSRRYFALDSLLLSSTYSLCSVTVLPLKWKFIVVFGDLKVSPFLRRSQLLSMMLLLSSIFYVFLLLFFFFSEFSTLNCNFRLSKWRSEKHSSRWDLKKKNKN